MAQVQGNFALQTLLNDFIVRLNFKPQKTVKLPRWQARELKVRQWFMPMVIALAVAALAISGLAMSGNFGLLRHSSSYYEEREFSNGALMPYDMIDSQH